MDVETKASFARSKSMDLNDFLIHSNALKIRLSRNLITQSDGGHYREYVNKWKLNETFKLKSINNFQELKGHHRNK